MRLIACLSIMLLSVSAAAPHRSKGYAGSTPVGLDGYVAFAEFDCARINADPRRSRVRVPIADNCEVTTPSPDGRLIAVGAPVGDADDDITLSVTGGLRVARLNQPTVLLWNPSSTGFLLNDSEGSGQVSRLRYFSHLGGRWTESRRLDQSASRLYLRRYDCRGGARSYTNVSGWNWTREGLLRAVVQEGVHSEGCLQPYEDRSVMLEVIGDPVTGRIASAREVRTLP